MPNPILFSLPIILKVVVVVLSYILFDAQLKRKAATPLRLKKINMASHRISGAQKKAEMMADVLHLASLNTWQTQSITASFL